VDHSDEDNATCATVAQPCGGNPDKVKCSNGKCIDLVAFCSNKASCEDELDNRRRQKCGMFQSDYRIVLYSTAKRFAFNGIVLYCIFVYY